MVEIWLFNKLYDFAYRAYLQVNLILNLHLDTLEYKIKMLPWDIYMHNTKFLYIFLLICVSLYFYYMTLNFLNHIKNTTNVKLFKINCTFKTYLDVI